MPPLVKNNRLITKGDNQQANRLLGSFFSLLPYLIAEKPATMIVISIKDLELTLEEVKRRSLARSHGGLQAEIVSLQLYKDSSGL